MPLTLSDLIKNPKAIEQLRNPRPRAFPKSPEDFDASDNPIHPLYGRGISADEHYDRIDDTPIGTPHTRRY